MSRIEAPAQRSFREMLFSDCARYRPTVAPSWFQIALLLPVHPGLLASVFLRLQQCLYRSGQVKLAWYTRTLCGLLTGADFVPSCEVGLGIHLVHPVGVVFGPGSKVGDNVTLASGVVLGVRDPDGDEMCCTIGDNVFLGAHSVVLGDVIVHENALVGANSVVVAAVPANVIVAGVPAKEVGRRSAPAEATVASA